MTDSSYQKIFELTRGQTVESVHQGAIAVVNAFGQLIAWYGDPNTVTFLRSTAKPFQALPFIAQGGQQHYGLTQREVAILCASHSGTDEHAAVVRGIQDKTGVHETDLLCGIHDPYDAATLQALRQRGEAPTQNRHNCSGKHTGMLAYVRMRSGQDQANDPNLPYIDARHPVQQEIVSTFAEMCDLPVNDVATGTDGCSAPNFAVPLRHAALAYARLCDPQAGGVTPPSRLAGCQTITTAMMAHPDMVGGPGRFDTRLMELTRGRIVSKGGAEAYQGIGLMPGALAPGSPGIGIALKIADGDARNKVRAAVTLEVLRQLGALTDNELKALADFGPGFPVLNIRQLEVGEAYPAFQLRRA